MDFEITKDQTVTIMIVRLTNSGTRRSWRIRKMYLSYKKKWTHLRS